MKLWVAIDKFGRIVYSGFNKQIVKDYLNGDVIYGPKENKKRFKVKLLKGV